MDKNDVVCIKPEKMEVLDVVGILINPNTPVNLPHDWKKFFPQGHLPVILAGEEAKVAFTIKQFSQILEQCPHPERKIYLVDVQELQRVVNDSLQFKERLASLGLPSP